MLTCHLTFPLSCQIWHVMSKKLLSLLFSKTCCNKIIDMMMEQFQLKCQMLINRRLIGTHFSLNACTYHTGLDLFVQREIWSNQPQASIGNRRTWFFHCRRSRRALQYERIQSLLQASFTLTKAIEIQIILWVITIRKTCSFKSLCNNLVHHSHCLPLWAF